jgi:phytanoyl-CoA hydroxylase
VLLDGTDTARGTASTWYDAALAERLAIDPSPALAAYAQDGLLVLPRVLSDTECDDLAVAARVLGDDGHEPQAPVMNPHRVHQTFLAALCHPTIVAVLERLIAGAVSGLQSQYFPGVPGTPGFAAHQDNHYVEARRDAFASAWIALDDVGVENGALIAWPGSQREPLLPVREIPGATPHPTQAFNAIRQEVRVPLGYAPRTLNVPRGGVVFLHGHLLHASHPNRSSRTRRALLATYVRRGSHFRAGNSARRTEIDVYATGRSS